MLPVMCLIHFKNIDAFTSYGLMQISVWNGQDYKEEATFFLNSKKFTVVNLTGNLDSDVAKLKSAQKSMKQIISTKDSIKGIKFHFEKKAQYWSYIKVIDILQIEKASTFLVYKDDIWFANPRILKPNKNLKTLKIERIICTSGRLQNEYLEKLEKERLEKNKYKIIYQNVISFCKKFYLPIMAYILMLFFTFKRIKEDIKYTS